MLIHEIPEGGVGRIDGALYVRPKGARIAQRVPDFVRVIEESDDTLTLVGPVQMSFGGTIYNVYLIHGEWYRHEVAKRAA